MKNCKKIYFLCALLAAVCLSSCIKEEPLNAECDVLEVYVSVNHPETMFYQLTDTLKKVKSDEDIVLFQVRNHADVTHLAPVFKLTEGATISPANGSAHDFSAGTVKYVVTSQDGQWKRTYEVGFYTPVVVTEYGFEHYELDAKYQKYYVWYEERDGQRENIWASGNGGFFIANNSKEAGEYPTVPDANGFDGQCLLLRTLDTGPLGKMTGRPIAAGNMFLGKFNAELALTDALHATEMGVPFVRKPLMLSGYYKYQPGPQYKDKAQNILENVTDSADIYSVLYRNHDDKGNPVVLYGDNVLTSPLIVRKARLPKIETTSEWVHFEINYEELGDIDEQLLAERGYNLALVFSSSKHGDLFEGAIGSTLYIDKVRIICEQ